MCGGKDVKLVIETIDQQIVLARQAHPRYCNRQIFRKMGEGGWYKSFVL